MRLRLIDLDGSVTAQGELMARAGQVVDLRPAGETLRLWARRSDMAAFARRLHEAGPIGGRGIPVSFYGSGDYHHLAAPLIAGAPGPVSVVHFDNHPDWGLWPPAYHCGSWVNRALDQPHVAKIVTIGPCSDAITWPQFKGANLHALADGRLELHPWAYAPSRVLGAVDGGPHGREGRLIRWHNLASLDWQGFLDEMIARLPTDNVWITLDKDVLDHAEAVTNWNQGQMPMEAILLAVRKLAAAKRLVGVDVCGEFAPPVFRNPFKRLLARFDQPPPPSAPDTAINQTTNLRLIQVLDDVGA